MAIPRIDPLRKVEVPVEQLGARSIRDFKEVEGQTIGTHDLSEHTGTAASIGAAGVDHSHFPVPAILVSDTQIANAAVLTLRATPVELVAAPGVGQATIVIAAYIVCDDAAGVYTETTDDLMVEYADGGNVLAGVGFDATLLVNIVGNGKLYRNGLAEFHMIPDENAVIQLLNTGGGEWGGGNAANSISVRVWYSVVPTVAFS